MLEVFSGFGVSRGVVAGRVLRMAPRPDLTEGADPDTTPDERKRRALAALEAVAGHLEERAATADKTATDVLYAQALMAVDPALTRSIDNNIDGGSSAHGAITAAFGTFRKALLGAGPYMAERVTDLDDIRDRALAGLLGLPMPGIPHPGHQFVLVADDLSPADTATLDPSEVIAIVTEQGGPSSHTAIIAKSLAIPAVAALAGADTLVDEDFVLVDGIAGTVTRSPDQDTVQTAVSRYQQAEARSASVSGPGQTADGAPILLLANIGGARDLPAAQAAEAEGVGLFRTEFLFLDRPSAPTIDEQVACYSEVFESFSGRRVVVRTLDAGADKPLQFVGQSAEPNPALGVRGLRINRFAADLIHDQLIAIGRAAAVSTADVWVMAPMVSVASEARDFVTDARGHGLNTVGVMVEVPAAALRARSVLAECDFVSIGTNDLTQYTFAADRQLGQLGDLLNPWHPALLDLVRISAEAGRVADKPVGVCGEAASDPELALVLVGLGVTSLSMAPNCIAAVRASLASHTLEQCREMAAVALDAADGVSAREAVRCHASVAA